MAYILYKSYVVRNYFVVVYRGELGEGRRDFLSLHRKSLAEPRFGSKLCKSFFGSAVRQPILPPQAFDCLLHEPF